MKRWMRAPDGGGECRESRLLRVLPALVLVGIGALGVAPASQAAVAGDGQWGYEQVTPVRKGGGTVQAVDSFQTRADGQAFLLSASAPFDEVPAESAPLYTRYLATRGPSGWSSRAIDVPFDPVPGAANSAVVSVLATSHNLAYAVVTSTRALAPGATPGGSNIYVRNTASGEYQFVATNSSPNLVGPLSTNLSWLSVKYVAPDGDAVVLVAPANFPLVDGLSAAEAALARLYRWTADGGLELVSSVPGIGGLEPSFADTAVGYNNEDWARGSLPRTDGASTIYFNSVTTDPIQGNNAGPVHQWTPSGVEVISKSQIPGDPSPPVVARVRATTSGGDYALIETTSAVPLTTDTPSFAPGAGRLLYRYERTSGELRYVGIVNGSPSGVEQMSLDGQTVVFRTMHQLTPDAPEYLGENDPGSRLSIYAWRDGTTRYIASVDPGARASGTNYLRVLSENGRFFSFVDNSLETAARFGVSDNTNPKCKSLGTLGSSQNACDQVYVFDTTADDSLACASCRAGAAPAGDSGDPRVIQGPMVMNGRQLQTVANDGTVFFTSAVDLTADDGNGLLDAYAYRDGQLRLVSGGVQGASARFLDATPDGASIFFATNAQLAETDTDRQVDVYVTRLGAGFPDLRQPETPPCSGSDCRTAPPGAGTEGAAPLGGSESVLGSPPPLSTAAKSTVRVTGVSRRGSRLRITVRVSGPGDLRVSGSSVRTTTRRASRAGDVALSVTLSKKARTSLRRGGRLKARIRVSLAPPFGKSAVTTSTRTVR